MKSNVKSAPVAKTSAPVVTAEAPAKVVKLKVLKKDAKFRGARQAWYEVLVAHDGKPESEYVETCTKTPPSVPKSGRVEAPSGWVSFFKRTGILSLEEVKPEAKG